MAPIPLALSDLYEHFSYFEMSLSPTQRKTQHVLTTLCLQTNENRTWSVTFTRRGKILLKVTGVSIVKQW